MAIHIVITDKDLGAGLHIDDKKVCPKVDETSIGLTPENELTVKLGESTFYKQDNAVYETKQIAGDEVVVGLYHTSGNFVSSALDDVSYTTLDKMFGKRTSVGYVDLTGVDFNYNGVTTVIDSPPEMLMTKSVNMRDYWNLSGEFAEISGSSPKEFVPVVDPNSVDKSFFRGESAQLKIVSAEDIDTDIDNAIERIDLSEIVYERRYNFSRTSLNITKTTTLTKFYVVPHLPQYLYNEVRVTKNDGVVSVEYTFSTGQTLRYENIDPVTFTNEDVFTA